MKAGKYITAGIKVRRGKKDTPEYLSPEFVWYEQAIHNASSWPVVLSDIGSRQHWMIDGATAILQVCQACIGSQNIPYTSPEVAQRLQYPNDRGTPKFAYTVLVDRSNRKQPLFIHRQDAGASPHDSDLEPEDETFGDLALKTWQRLELLHDRALHPREEDSIQLTLKRRELIGFELNDLVEGKTTFPPKAIQLLGGTSHWLQVGAKLGAINLFARNLGSLIRAKESHPHPTHHALLPHHSDFLATTMAVLKELVRDRINHTDHSVELADGLFWSYPSGHFDQCTCGANLTRSCTKTVLQLDSKARTGRNGGLIEVHPIFERFPCGALVFGHSSGNTIESQHRLPSIAPAPPQIQASSRSSTHSSHGSIGEPLESQSSNASASLQSSVSGGGAGSSSQTTSMSSQSLPPTVAPPSKIPVRPKGKNKVRSGMISSALSRK